MNDRARQAILGLLFWIVFAPPAALCLILQPFGILLYTLGWDAVRDWVYRTGKAADQLNNAAWFDGLPQETISSHTGRWVQSGRPMPWRFRFVQWLTDKFEQDHAVKAIEAPFVSQPL